MWTVGRSSVDGSMPAAVCDRPVVTTQMHHEVAHRSDAVLSEAATAAATARSAAGPTRRPVPGTAQGADGPRRRRRHRRRGRHRTRPASGVAWFAMETDLTVDPPAGRAASAADSTRERSSGAGALAVATPIHSATRLNSAISAAHVGQRLACSATDRASSGGQASITYGPTRSSGCPSSVMSISKSCACRP